MLLHRQDELNKLEKRLNALDLRDNVGDDFRIQCITYDREKDTQRTDLIDEIDSKLEHYGNCIWYISRGVMADTQRRDAVPRPKSTIYRTSDKAQSQELVQLDLESAATRTFRTRLHLPPRRFRDSGERSRQQLARSSR